MGMAETTYREFQLPRRGSRAAEQGREMDVQRENDLEALIDEAGRDAVFAYAAAAGWSIANPPEKWVWRQMAYEVLRIKAETNAAR